MTATEPAPPQASRAVHIVLGLFVMTVGLLLLVDTFDSWWNFEFSVHLWPFVLVFLGLARVADPGLDPQGQRRSARMGWWLLFLGFWGLVSAYRVLGMNYGNTWPILLFGAGAMIVWRAVDPGERAPVVTEERHQ